jgi:hypothetical protein
MEIQLQIEEPPKYGPAGSYEGGCITNHSKGRKTSHTKIGMEHGSFINFFKKITYDMGK